MNGLGKEMDKVVTRAQDNLDALERKTDVIAEQTKSLLGSDRQDVSREHSKELQRKVNDSLEEVREINGNTENLHIKAGEENNLPAEEMLENIYYAQKIIIDRLETCSSQIQDLINSLFG